MRSLVVFMCGLVMLLAGGLAGGVAVLLEGQ